MSNQETFVAPRSAKSVVKVIPISKLKVNKTRNTRRSGKYDLNDKPFKKLVESMKTIGFVEGNHITVHDDGDGTFDVLRGHRRTEAAKAAGIESIPCIVLSGLSEADKLQVLVDIGNVEGLDEVEMLEAVRRLVFAGLGRNAIAKKLGKEPNWVQHRQRLLSLPPYVQSQWTLQQDSGKEAEGLELNCSWDNIKAMHTAQVSDRESGYDEEGPKYVQEVTKLRAGGTNSIKEKANKAYTATQMEGMANASHRKWIRRLLMFLATSQGDVREILDQLEAAHDLYFGQPEGLKAPSVPASEVPTTV